MLVHLGSLGLAALLRCVGGETSVETIALRAFTVWVYLPAWCVLALSLGRRRWTIAAIAGGLVMLHLAWMAPSLRTAKRGRERFRRCTLSGSSRRTFSV